MTNSMIQVYFFMLWDKSEFDNNKHCTDAGHRPIK